MAENGELSVCLNYRDLSPSRWHSTVIYPNRDAEIREDLYYIFPRLSSNVSGLEF